jgi:3-dehydroquinate synthase
MTSETIIVRHRPEKSDYDVQVASGALPGIGAWANRCLSGTARKAVVVSNSRVFGLYGETVSKSLRSAGFKVSVWLMGDGERFKNQRSLERTLRSLSEARLSRDDVVVALGGGVVGDLAGFAAAVYLRGIRFLQIPTTLLAMIDSSVGGKVGINSEFGKNLIGAFHGPAGVLIDVETLKTLPRRELTAGFCEAIKQGAVAGKGLFTKTASYLAEWSAARRLFDSDGLVPLIADHVAFKASIVRQDEKESTKRTDVRSRKILNFGHTFGHALEKATNFRRLRHGEAVGYGILLAGQLSKSLDLLSGDELKLLNDVVHRAGRLPSIANIDLDSIFDALQHDKKSTGGELKWVLLKGIGKPVIVSEKDIPPTALKKAVRTILGK